MAFSLGQLFVKLGFDIPNQDITRINDFTNKVTAVSAAFIAVRQFASDAVTGINAVIRSVEDESASLQSFTKQTGYGIDALNKWRYALVQGDPTQTFEKSIGDMQGFIENLHKALIGAGDVSGFMLSGIQILNSSGTGLRSIDDIMYDIAKHIHDIHMSAPDIVVMLQKMHLPGSALPGLQYMADHLEEVRKNAPLELIGANQSAEINKVNIAWVNLSMTANKFWADVLEANAPALVDIMNDLIGVIRDIDWALKPFGKFLHENKQIAKDILLTFTALSATITTFLGISGFLALSHKILTLWTGIASAMGAAAGAAGTAAGAAGAAGTAAGAVGAAGTAAGAVGAVSAAGTGTALTVTEAPILEGTLVAGGLAIPVIGEILAVVLVIGAGVAGAYEVAKNQKVILEDIKDAFDWMKDQYMGVGKEISSGKIIPDALHLLKNLIIPQAHAEEHLNHQNINPVSPANLPKMLPIQETRPSNVPANLSQTNHINITSHQPIEETKRIAKETFNEGMNQVAINSYYLMPESK